MLRVKIMFTDKSGFEIFDRIHSIREADNYLILTSSNKKIKKLNKKKILLVKVDVSEECDDRTRED